MALVSVEEEESLKIRVGHTFGEWKIIRKLDEGGFGKVFLVESVKNSSRKAALKAESSKTGGGAAIKLEIAILELLNKDGVRPHIAELYRAKRRSRFHYMVVTLLGENFRTLKLARESQTLSVSTWSRLAIQCLYSLKLLHEVGYIHRDIKPANFAMGYRNDADRARVVHILDFGMAREFARQKSGKWIVRRARPSIDFRGTYRYCSPNVLAGREQGRVDDVWSLIYMLIELHCGLPWQKEVDKRSIADMKMNYTDKELLKDFPDEFSEVMPMLHSLNYYSRPDYSMIHNACLELMKNNNIRFEDPYDWETKNEIIRRQKAPDYENATKFFELDAVKIHGPPKENTSRESMRKSVTIRKPPTSSSDAGDT
ncbi:protein kinase domain-containing protein [Ditylenchus destructor]|nr:protein kinase domain-containing protein [Ditylenchus destructor]